MIIYKSYNYYISIEYIIIALVAIVEKYANKTV